MASIGKITTLLVKFYCNNFQTFNANIRFNFLLNSNCETCDCNFKASKTLKCSLKGERGYVFYEESPHSCKSSLNIEPVSVEDSGQYRCRVDYDTSPTRNTRIKLKLVGNNNNPFLFPQNMFHFQLVQQNL